MSKLLRADFNIGSIMGENDRFLLDAYYDNGDYAAISSLLDRRCFIIGRTGAGKSAAFRQLAENHPGRVVRVTPEDLSFQYLTSLELIDRLTTFKVHLEPFFTALWKHVLIVEIIKHRYGISSKEKRDNTLYLLRNKLQRDPAKVKALDYLEEFGEKFWAETDERVREITDNFVEKFESSAGLDAKVPNVGGIKIEGGYERNKSRETKTEIASRYQKIVNETQLPKLNQVIRILGNEILDSHQHFTYLVVDDLDKEWVDEKLANTLIP